MARLRDRTAAGWRYDPQGHEALDIVRTCCLLQLVNTPRTNYGSPDKLSGTGSWSTTGTTRPLLLPAPGPTGNSNSVRSRRAMTARRSRFRFVRPSVWPSLATFSRMKWRH